MERSRAATLDIVPMILPRRAPFDQLRCRTWPVVLMATSNKTVRGKSRPSRPTV
jgi:hypothetical protein